MPSAESTMTITPLGAGQEVGRSCHIITFRGKTIMLDCGIHPGYGQGQDGLPFFDALECDLSEVDFCLITHFHLDHVAALPYLTEQTSFKGRVFMTHPTRAVSKLMLQDTIRVQDGEQLFDETQLKACFEKVEIIDFHQVIEVEGVRFQCYHAGHVLGAAMFALDFGHGTRILYTGDYTLAEDRHLRKAEIPSFTPDVLICEATFGQERHTDRADREARLAAAIEDIVLGGGKCLMPLFAVGRAQELMLILDELWERKPELQRVPIYYASRMSHDAMKVYKTYTHMMSAAVHGRVETRNAFDFMHIKRLGGGRANLDQPGPVVVLASPGMLQTGLSRQLCESWCGEEKNGIILAGYSVEGTLAHQLLEMGGGGHIEAKDGRTLEVKCKIAAFAFTAHADANQTNDFVRRLQPRHVVLVHGQQRGMMVLKNELLRNNKQRARRDAFHVHTPANGETVSIAVQHQHRAKAVGSVAAVAAAALEGDGSAAAGAPAAKEGGGGAPLEGLYVSSGFAGHLVAPDELSKFSCFGELCTSAVTQRLHVPFGGLNAAPSSAFERLHECVARMYRGVGEVPLLDIGAAVVDPTAKDARCLQVGGVVGGDARRGDARGTAPSKTELAKKRVAELKELCIARGLEPKGVKAALIELIIKSYSRGGRSSSSSSSSSGTASSRSESTADVPTVRATYFPARQRLLLEWLSSAVRLVCFLASRTHARRSPLASFAPCASRHRLCCRTF